MGCKYKYNNEWYSKDEVRELLLKENGINFKGELVKPEISKKSRLNELNPNYKYIAKQMSSNELHHTHDKNYFAIYQVLSNEELAIISTEEDYLEPYLFKTKQEADNFIKLNTEKFGKQPTQTKENTTSIESVLDKYNKNDRYIPSGDVGYVAKDDLGNITSIFDDIKKAENQVKLWQETNPNDGWRIEKVNKLKEKEYTSQAETNLKIAALKEVARKYPRSLVTSKVVPINPNLEGSSEIQYSKKQGYNSKLITDEYGNTWNEITLNQIDNKKILLNKGEEINVSIDSNLRSTYFPEGNVTTLTDALKKIAQSDSVYSAIAKKLLKFSENTNTTIELVPTNLFRNSEELNLNSDIGIGYYSPKEDKIYIAENALFYNGRAEGTLLHEILHGISHYSLQGTEAANDFNKLFEYAKANLEHSHALDDIDEFLVALFTKPEFIKKLQQLKPLDNIKGYKNLLEEIFDYLLKLVGITKKDSLYTQAFSIATNILENERLQNEINHTIIPDNTENTEDLNEYEEYIDPNSFTLKNLASSGEDGFNEGDTIDFDNIRIQEENEENLEDEISSDGIIIHSAKEQELVQTQIKRLENLELELQTAPKKDTLERKKINSRIQIIKNSIERLYNNIGFNTLLSTQNKSVLNGIEVLDDESEKDFKYIQNVIDYTASLISALYQEDVYSDLNEEQKGKLVQLNVNLGKLQHKFNAVSTKVANEIANEIGVNYTPVNVAKKDISGFTRNFLSLAEARNIPEAQIISKYLEYSKNKVIELVSKLKENISTIKEQFLDWEEQVKSFFDSEGKFIIKSIHKYYDEEKRINQEKDAILRDPESSNLQMALAFNAVRDWYIDNADYSRSATGNLIWEQELENWKKINEDLERENPAQYAADLFVFEEENSPQKYLEYINNVKANPEYYQPGVKRRIGYRKLLVTPKEKYNNPDYEKVKDNPIYKLIEKIIIDSQKLIPRQTTFDTGNFDKVLSQFTLDLSETSTVKSLLQGLSKTFTEWYTPARESTGINFSAVDSKGEDISFVHAPKLKEFTESTPDDLFDVLTKFYAMAVQYSTQSDILPVVQLFSDKLAERPKIKTNAFGVSSYRNKKDPSTGKYLKDENGNFIKEDKPEEIASGLKNARDLVLYNIRAQIFGETKSDEDSKVARMADKIINYTRILGIGGKPFSAINNYIVGKMNNYAWAAKGLDFDDEDFLKAQKIVNGNILRAFSIDRSLTEDAKKLALLIQKFDIMGHGINKFEGSQSKLTDLMYFLMTSGEYMIHSEGFIAKMLHTKLDKLDGTKGSLWEYFKVGENNEIQYNHKEFGEQKGYEEVLPNSELNNWLYQFNEYRKATQGDYTNPKMINQKFWGRSMMIFRTWIPQAAYQRFGGKSDDGEFKGRFLSVLDVNNAFKDPGQKGIQKAVPIIKTILTLIGESTYINAAKRKIQGQIFEEEYKKLGLSNTDVSNMLVNIRELRMLVWIFGIMFALGAAGGDDDDKGLILAANISQRVYQDLTFFANPNSFGAIIKNPIPVYGTWLKANDVINAGVNYISGGNDTYQQGIHKDQSKLWISTQKVIPGVAAYQSTLGVLNTKFNSQSARYSN